MILASGDITPRNYSSIISVVPSLTELLYDLGLEEKVKGITKFCSHPHKWHETKMKVGGTKTLNIEKIRSLQPDLIIANKEENTREQIEELAASCNVLLTDVNSLTTALETIQDIGILTHTKEKAFALADEIETRFSQLQKRMVVKKKIRTGYFIWKNPFMVTGRNTFINDMMHLCGLENIFAHRERYPHVRPEDLYREKSICELVILPSEPFPFTEKHIPEFRSVFPKAKVVLADGEMFSWYGSHLLYAADYFENFLNKIHFSK